MKVSLELLVMKLYVMANMLGIMGWIGLAVLIVAVIWMMIQIANSNSSIPPLMGILLSLVLIAGGLACSPVSDKAAGYTVVAWLSDILGLDLGEIREFMGASEDSIQDFLDLFGFSDMMDLFGDGDKGSKEDTKNEDTIEGYFTEEYTTGEYSTEGYPYEGIISGWRIRLTLPEEWKDACVIKNAGTYLNFSQKVSALNYGGHLFSLFIEDGSFDPYADDGPPAFDIVMEKEGIILLAIYPTDVQFNYEVEEIMEEYNRMQAAIPGILDSIELERA